MIELTIGVVGMLCILSAFIMEDFGKIHRSGSVYNILNLIGALFLMVYAYFNNVVIFIILNIFWAVIAIYFLIRNK